MEIELKHTWRASRNAWYIRFFRLIYQANDDDITFCKMFWGYLMMWIVLPVWLICFAVVGIAIGIKSVMPDSRRVDQCHKCKRGKPHTTHRFLLCSCNRSTIPELRYHASFCKLQQGYKLAYDDTLLVDKVLPSQRMRFINAIGYGFTRLGMWWRKPNVKRNIGIAICAPVALFGIWAIVQVVMLGVAQPPSTWLDIFKWGGIGLGSITGIIGVAYVLAVIGLWRLMARISKVFERGGKRTTMGFGRMMKLGYIAVKSNTCPRIELED